jgi:hypothetical protein
VVGKEAEIKEGGVLVFDIYKMDVTPQNIPPLKPRPS